MSLKKRLTDFYRSRNFPYAVLAIFALLLHLCILKLFGDDLTYAKSLNQTDLFSFLMTLYRSWSSRLLILGSDVILLKFHVLVWKILDSAMFLLAGLSLSRLAGPKTSRRENWILVFLLMSYPFQQMASAGWVTTSVNYLWPIALGLFSLIPLKKVSEDKPFRLFEYFLYLPALIFACNQEQAAAVLLGFFFCLSCYDIFVSRKYHWLLGAETAVSFASLLFHAVCPGNYARMLAETKTWMPDFSRFTFPDKLILGFTTSADELTGIPSKALGKLISSSAVIPNLTFLLFCIVLFFAVKNIYQKSSQEKAAMFLLVSSVLFPIFRDAVTVLFPQAKIFGTEKFLISSSTVHSVLFFIPVAADFLALVLPVIMLYFILGKSRDFLLVFLVLAVGFASRMIMGFSPTLYGSGSRTFSFLYFSIIFAAFFTYTKTDSQLAEATEKIQYRLFTVFGICGALRSVFYIFLYNYKYR